MQVEAEAEARWRRLVGIGSTVVFSLLMTGSALLFLSGAPQVAQSLGALGYPGYLAKLLGAAKLGGVAALWLPVPKALREWAYAGFVFNLLGAVASHLASPGPRGHALQPAVLLVPLLLSYLFRHRAAAAAAGAARDGGDAGAARAVAWR
jgi:hypothetical protein